MSGAGELLGKPLRVCTGTNLPCSDAGLDGTGQPGICAPNEVILNYRAHHSRSQSSVQHWEHPACGTEGMVVCVGTNGGGQTWRCRKLNLVEMRKRMGFRPCQGLFLMKRSLRARFCRRGCWIPGHKRGCLGKKRLTCCSFVLLCLSFQKKNCL